MARKRKIPVRKHHGIRDPLKQLEAKEKKLKNVVDSPPEKDDQKMSFKFGQFKKLADQVKTGNKIKRIRSGVEDIPKDRKTTKKKVTNTNKVDGGNKFKSIKQLPGEEDLDYMRRINRITSASLKEAQYEAKYGVKVVRDPTSGEISIKKKPLNEIDQLLKQKQKEARGGRINKKKTDEKVKALDPKLAKQLIKQAIREDEEEKLKEKSKEIVEYRRDVVKFGEIVHAPPSILTLPRKAQKNDTVPRPGKKNNLLLQNMLKPNEGDNSDTSSSKPTADTSKKVKSLTTNNKTLMKGKRKDLPEATRNMLENERLKLVSLYRDLKKSKGIQSDRS